MGGKINPIFRKGKNMHPLWCCHCYVFKTSWNTVLFVSVRFIYFILCVRVLSECRQVCTACTVLAAHRGLMRVSDQLWMVVSLHVGVLGTKLRSSAGTVSGHTHLATSPATALPFSWSSLEEKRLFLLQTDQVLEALMAFHASSVYYIWILLLFH